MNRRRRTSCWLDIRLEGHRSLELLAVPYTRLLLSGTALSRQVPVARVERTFTNWCRPANQGNPNTVPRLQDLVEYWRPDP